MSASTIRGVEVGGYVFVPAEHQVGLDSNSRQRIFEPIVGKFAIPGGKIVTRATLESWALSEKLTVAYR